MPTYIPIISTTTLLIGYSHFFGEGIMTIMTAHPAFTVPPPALATADGLLLTSGGMTKGLPPEMWGIQP